MYLYPSWTNWWARHISFKLLMCTNWENENEIVNSTTHFTWFYAIHQSFLPKHSHNLKLKGAPHVCYNDCYVNDVEHWPKFPHRSSFFLEQIIPKLRETNREEFFVIIFSHAKKNMKILAKQGKFSITDISSVPWFKKGSFKNDIKIGSKSLRQIWAFCFLLCCYSSCCMIIN